MQHRAHRRRDRRDPARSCRGLRRGAFAALRGGQLPAAAVRRTSSASSNYYADRRRRERLRHTDEIGSMGEESWRCADRHRARPARCTRTESDHGPVTRQRFKPRQRTAATRIARWSIPPRRRETGLHMLLWSPSRKLIEAAESRPSRRRRRGGAKIRHGTPLPEAVTAIRPGRGPALSGTHGGGHRLKSKVVGVAVAAAATYRHRRVVNENLGRLKLERGSAR